MVQLLFYLFANLNNCQIVKMDSYDFLMYKNIFYFLCWARKEVWFTIPTDNGYTRNVPSKSLPVEEPKLESKNYVLFHHRVLWFKPCVLLCRAVACSSVILWFILKWNAYYYHFVPIRHCPPWQTKQTKKIGSRRNK